MKLVATVALILVLLLGGCSPAKTFSEIESQYDFILEVEDVGGKLAFIAGRDNRNFIVLEK